MVVSRNVAMVKLCKAFCACAGIVLFLLHNTPNINIDARHSVHVPASYCSCYTTGRTSTSMQGILCMCRHRIVPVTQHAEHQHRCKAFCACAGIIMFLLHNMPNININLTTNTTSMYHTANLFPKKCRQIGVPVIASAASSENMCSCVLLNYV